MVITRPSSADKVEYFRNSFFNINWLHLLKEPVIINKYTAKEVFETFLYGFYIFEICIPQHKIKVQTQGHKKKKLLNVGTLHSLLLRKIK